MRHARMLQHFIIRVFDGSAHFSSFIAILSGSVSPSNSTITGAPMLEGWRSDNSNLMGFPVLQLCILDNPVMGLYNASFTVRRIGSQ